MRITAAPLNKRLRLHLAVHAGNTMTIKTTLLLIAAAGLT